MSNLFLTYTNGHGFNKKVEIYNNTNIDHDIMVAIKVTSKCLDSKTHSKEKMNIFHTSLQNIHITKILPLSKIVDDVANPELSSVSLYI